MNNNITCLYAKVILFCTYCCSQSFKMKSWSWRIASSLTTFPVSGLLFFASLSSLPSSARWSFFLPFPPLLSFLSLFHPPLHPQEPVFSSTFSPTISLGQKCQYIDHHSQVRTCTWHARMHALESYISAWFAATGVKGAVEFYMVPTAWVRLWNKVKQIKSFYICLVWYCDYVNNCSRGKSHEVKVKLCERWCSSPTPGK